MKIERGSLAVATLGDYIYAVGGGKPNIQYDSVERYNAGPSVCIFDACPIDQKL